MAACCLLVLLFGEGGGGAWEGAICVSICLSVSLLFSVSDLFNLILSRLLNESYAKNIQREADTVDFAPFFSDTE